MPTQASTPSASASWHLFKDPSDNCLYVADANGLRVAFPYGPGAIARLIAAAPDLLKVAKMARATYGERLSLLQEEREWRGDDETDDMIGHYTSLLSATKIAIAKVDAS